MSQSYFPSDFSSQGGVSPTRRQRAYGLDAKIVVLGNSGQSSSPVKRIPLTSLLFPGVGKTSLLQVGVNILFECRVVPFSSTRSGMFKTATTPNGRRRPLVRSLRRSVCTWTTRK
jgi:hypothetical protein